MGKKKKSRFKDKFVRLIWNTDFLTFLGILLGLFIQIIMKLIEGKMLSGKESYLVSMSFIRTLIISGIVGIRLRILMIQLRLTI